MVLSPQNEEALIQEMNFPEFNVAYNAKRLLQIFHPLISGHTASPDPKDHERFGTKICMLYLEAAEYHHVQFGVHNRLSNHFRVCT